MTNVVLVADDLTGAADSAAPFASHGLSTRLILGKQPAPLGKVDVTALSTRSRDMSSDDALAAIADACDWIDRHGPESPIIFKKIDSTMRGHIASELDYVITRFGIERMLVSPAFPSQGRTTLQARHHVHGIPLSRTAFASDGKSDDLLERFDGIAGLSARHVPIELLRGSKPLGPLFEHPGMYIPDIQSDADMLRFVKEARKAGIEHCCGAAGLSRALAESIGEPARPELAERMCAGPMLIIAGSQSQATIDQVEATRPLGTIIIPLDSESPDLGNEISHYLGKGQNVILTSKTTGPEHFTPETVRMRLAELVVQVVQAAPIKTLLLTGGEVAGAVCNRLGVTDITLNGELEPGMPVGSLESDLISGLTIITKAGGFGDRQTFVRLLELARKSPRSR
jgi:D-threonate/D-erythronate kinase